MTSNEEQSIMRQMLTSVTPGNGRQLRQRQPKKYDDPDKFQGGNGSGRSRNRRSKDFVPELSQREMRKVNKRINDSQRKNALYDCTGRLAADSRDLCDCLEPNCPGCHMPCTKCDSEKCGQDCRINRRWVYCEVEIEGGEQKFHFK